MAIHILQRRCLEEMPSRLDVHATADCECVYFGSKNVKASGQFLQSYSIPHSIVCRKKQRMYQQRDRDGTKMEQSWFRAYNVGVQNFAFRIGWLQCKGLRHCTWFAQAIEGVPLTLHIKQLAIKTACKATPLNILKRTKLGYV